MPDENESLLMKRIGAAEKRTRFPGQQKNERDFQFAGKRERRECEGMAKGAGGRRAGYLSDKLYFIRASGKLS